MLLLIARHLVDLAKQLTLSRARDPERGTVSWTLATPYVETTSSYTSILIKYCTSTGLTPRRSEMAQPIVPVARSLSKMRHGNYDHSQVSKPKHHSKLEPADCNVSHFVTSRCIFSEWKTFRRSFNRVESAVYLVD